jgi:hypothetical protein
MFTFICVVSSLYGQVKKSLNNSYIENIDFGFSLLEKCFKTLIFKRVAEGKLQFSVISLMQLYSLKYILVNILN